MDDRLDLPCAQEGGTPEPTPQTGIAEETGPARPSRSLGRGRNCAKTSGMNGWFQRFSHATAEMVGRSEAFLSAAFVVVLWSMTGPLFHFSDTWQLVINTGTTIVTFLMVFLIQNTQNRDAHAMHLKLDELIRANKGARNALLGLESMSDDELRRLQREFEELRDKIVHARKKQSQFTLPE
jgi:low affinity Fe/Cu permease